MSKWVTLWGNATSIADHKVETYAKDITLRYNITSPLSGDKLRLHFSNFCGTEPITLDKVTIASSCGKEIDLTDAIEVTFNGKQSVVIAKGAEIYSDEIPFKVKRRGEIAVSFYLKDFTQMRSAVVITGKYSGGFYSLGDQTLTKILPLDTTRRTSTYYFLTGVDVMTDDNAKAVILYGDSITAQNWADDLLDLCLNDPDNTTSIVRRAASGTRILREYTCITYESYGLSGEHRFEREISTVSGADSVIIQQGINDIIHPVGVEVNPFRPMSDLPTVEELEEGIEYYIALAKKYNLKVYLGTLLPIYGWRTYADFREDMRGKFNDYLRSIGDISGVIDFDAALRGSENPFAFEEKFDSGDHLHPSQDGYRLMAKIAYERLK